MTKRIISLLLVTVMVLGLMAACGNKVLDVEDAKKVALKDLGVKEKDVDQVDVHIGSFNGASCYSVYISVNGEHMEYLIHGQTGEILSKEERDSAHSH